MAFFDQMGNFAVVCRMISSHHVDGDEPEELISSLTFPSMLAIVRSSLRP